MTVPNKISRFTAALLVGFSTFVLAGLLYMTGAFDFAEYKTYDFRVRFFAEKSRPSDNIALILLNQASLDWAKEERRWSWPWPRAAYAEIADYLNLGGAASLSFDIIFSEPSIYGDEDDEEFIRASKQYGKVGQTVFFSSSTGVQQEWPSGLDTPLFAVTGFDELPRTLHIESRIPDSGAVSMVLPIPGLRDAAGALGNITGIADSDDVFRRLSPFILFDGKAVPGLSPAALMLGGSGTDIAYNKKKQSFSWGDYVIPVDKDGRALLRFRGSLNRYSPYSAAEVLQSAEAYRQGGEALLLPEDFAGRHVFVGLYAPGLFDICTTPIESAYPGMGMHVTMLDNMLQGDFIRKSSVGLDFFILFAVIMLIAFMSIASNRIPLPATVAASAALLAAEAAACFASYELLGLWIPMAAPLSGGLLAFLAGTLYNYATEGRQKRFIKSAFSQYLSPAVIEQIIADPSQLKLGGEKREMTAIFTDVRSFSTISEALGDPAKLVELLNHYLTRMSDIILANQGTIDKYEGDAIIAFFGAPIHMSDHARLACRSAVQMKKAEETINREAMDLGLINSAVMEALFRKGIITDIHDPSPIFTRLGINTGDMVVGNMGTPSKMDYTIMGNAVNLAARLEGVNKQYNTGGILISEYTRAVLTDEFVTRPLSRVRVVGINTPLRLYELLDLREEAAPELLETVKSWEEGFTAYESKDFSAAAGIFGGIYGKNQSDLAAKKYLDRCAAYLANPPADEKWDNGVDNLSEK